MGRDQEPNAIMLAELRAIEAMHDRPLSDRLAPLGATVVGASIEAFRQCHAVASTLVGFTTDFGGRLLHR